MSRNRLAIWMGWVGLAFSLLLAVTPAFAQAPENYVVHPGRVVPHADAFRPRHRSAQGTGPQGI